ncbi:uncharacterized protein DUF1329 [Limnobacter thiooxidans]|uniref:DUF1329 domain-containing protein n=1 Tax=Limnobacter thiooxidans TaxID=131080 RepID=A0AA86IZ95_9BURK|nr:DUF1329 domain-containing protein [Limnobacter sp.]MCZ8016900.1 DUF1329 domain-containing protein [Limnobacter sp.]RZS38620.1 uncharacterized protein DUF1329 [Limnobacter thiooxidans]BET24931.1 DUF1329 domain-containing protein [Limnobacter thiooxidans]
MLKFQTKLTALALTGLFAVSAAQAAVSPQEAAKLGTSLTEFGAEKAGNAAGTIPAYTGGLTKAPAGYKAGQHLVDPFASEKPLFTITGANADKYKANLSPGQLEMLKKYPTFKMNVYPTHRSTAYPKKVLDAAKKNATNAKTDNNGNTVVNFEQAIPFPIPQNGVEVIWNHLTRYRGGAAKRDFVQVPVERDGTFIINRIEDTLVFPRNLPNFFKAGEDENINFYFYQILKSPVSVSGNVLLVHDTLDQVTEGRRAWQYNAGQRRVRRAPQVAYDSPGTAADGLRTTDNYDLYNGAPDRYEWKLKGKKEMYIPYNSYRLANNKLTYKEIHQPLHMNPEVLRYELHRVWEVEATLKSDARHIYAKRVFFVDEDNWQASVIDHYDGKGALWRVAEAHNIQYYNEMVPFYAAEALYDLQAGRYLTIGLTNEAAQPFVFDFTPDRANYTPAGLRRLGVQ